MATGKVKWFNNAKGYGFILADQGGEDLFAHFSSIQMDGYKTLKAGQSVDFDLVEGPKGNHAVNIRESGADAAADTVPNADTGTDAHADTVADTAQAPSDEAAADSETTSAADSLEISDNIGNR